MKSSLQKTLPLLCAAILIFAGCSTTNKQTGSGPQSLAEKSQNFPLLPEGITSFGAVTDHGWLYIFGGYTGKRHDYSIEKVRGTFYRINLTHDGRGQSWEPLPAGEPAQGTAIVADGNYIYRIGGMAAKNHAGEKQDLVSQSIFSRYDIKRRVWEDLASLPEGRSTHDAIIAGGKIYVGGGWNLNGDPLNEDPHAAQWQDSLLVLDLRQSGAQWQKISQPFKRRAIAMTAIGSKIYFIGGMDSENNTSRAVDIYDTTTRVWSQGPDLPHATMDGFGFAVASIRNNIYASGYSGQLLRLSPNGKQWQPVGKLNESRFFHRLVLLQDGRLLAIGGEGSHGKLRDSEFLTP